MGHEVLFNTSPEKKKQNLPGPGFEPGLLRPQRSVLTTRRSRLHVPIGRKIKYITVLINDVHIRHFRFRWNDRKISIVIFPKHDRL